MADLTPAATLRAAATLIRETASNATQGHPAPWHAEPDFNGWWHVATPAPHLVTSAAKEPVAAWIALMSPAVAEPLAAWLGGAGDDLGGAEAYLARTAPPGEIFDPFDYVDEPESVRAALAFARSILGRTQ